MSDLLVLLTVGYAVCALVLVAVFCTLVHPTRLISDELFALGFFSLLVPGIVLWQTVFFQGTILCFQSGENVCGWILFVLGTVITGLAGGVFTAMLFAKDKTDCTVTFSISLVLSVLLCVVGGQIIYDYLRLVTQVVFAVVGGFCLIPPLILTVEKVRRCFTSLRTVCYHGYLRCRKCGRLEGNLLNIKESCGRCSGGCWDKVLARKVYRRSLDPITWFRYEWELKDQPWTEDPAPPNQGQLPNHNMHGMPDVIPDLRGMPYSQILRNQ